MRPLLNGLCSLTIAASVWLGVMFVVLHRPGYERGAGMAALFVLQSLLALAVTNQRLTGAWWRMAALLGAAGLTWVGVSAVVSNLTGPHFEGFAVIIGILLVLQGLFTAGALVTSLLTPSSKVHQFGN
jgi:hypothetical protein